MSDIDSLVEYLRKSERLSKVAMRYVYVLDLFGLLCYIIASLVPGYWACGLNKGIAPFHIPHEFFQVFFISTAGMLFALNIWLILTSFGKVRKTTWRVALPLYIAIQGLNVFINILFVLCCDGFLESGYLHIFTCTFLTIIYLRRYLTLKLQDKHTHRLKEGA